MIGGAAFARLSMGLLLLAATLVVATVLVASGPANAGGFSARDLIDGFHKTVFGLEYSASGYGRMVKKYHGPVRLHVVNAAAIDRRGEVGRFVNRLNGVVPGLDIAMAPSASAANFTVYVVDRAHYQATVRQGVLGSHGPVLGQCIVRIEPGNGGIRRSTAVIVSDEGDALFHRCMIEEILQGLGPINDDASLSQSMFNDRSSHCSLMPFDRAIVAILYDRRIRNGMSRREADSVLPTVLADVAGAVR